MEIDGYDCFGAGSYPEPPEIEEQNISGEITLTYEIDADVPKKWSLEQIKEFIVENLSDYIYLKDYKDIDIDLGCLGCSDD